MPCTTESTTLACTTDRFSLWTMMVIPVPAVLAQATAPAGTAPVAPRPAATGTGLTEDSTSPLPMMALVLVAGGMVGGGAYAVRRRRP